MRNKALLLTIALLLGNYAIAQVHTYLDRTKNIEERVEDALSRMTLTEKLKVIHAQSKFSSAGVPRLGFPDFWTSDGPHGIRTNTLWDEWTDANQTNDSCVAFPALTCLAATWNPEVAYLFGKSLGEEARYRGKDMVLGPGVNIYRTPLNGRNFEYMGEDPYLAGQMAVPYIQGIQSNGVAACVKHYPLNQDENNRIEENIIVDDRALHEIYLAPFKEAVIKGHVWGIMGAYPSYKDQSCTYNAYLTNKVLKGDWGYDGVVLSDWGATHETEGAVRHGLDIEFGTWTDGKKYGDSKHYNRYYLADAYRKGLEEGRYTMESLDNKVRRVLRLFYRTTMTYREPGSLTSDEHFAVARRIGEEGVVLLKNERQILPLQLKPGKRILVIGENAIKMMTAGGGSSSIRTKHEFVPLDALRRYTDKAGVQLDFARGYVGDTVTMFNGASVGQDIRDSRTPQQLMDEAVTKAHGADYILIFGGLNKSEYQDCEGYDRKNYSMPYQQDQLVEALAKVNKNIVFVNISGNTVAMPWVERVSGIIQAWYQGSEAGNVIASILVGETNPSGKLPYTWTVRLNDVPAHTLGTYPGTWRADHKVIEVEYKEGIFVGYRWADKHHVRPLFAFGHGLSYTAFKLSEAKADKSAMTPSDSITFTVTVQNIGQRAGSEVVQLYIKDKEASLPRPVKELKGFRKVFLQPGESRNVSITIGKDALSFYDDRQQQWVAEPGHFEALIGTASDKIASHVKFTLLK